MKLTKYPKSNFVILKTIEVALLCLVPFWVGRLSNWIYARTNWKAFVLCGDTISCIWLDGMATITVFAVAIVFIGFIVICACLIFKQNLKWAKKLAGEDEEDETR